MNAAPNQSLSHQTALPVAFRNFPEQSPARTVHDTCVRESEYHEKLVIHKPRKLFAQLPFQINSFSCRVSVMQARLLSASVSVLCAGKQVAHLRDSRSLISHNFRRLLFVSALEAAKYKRQKRVMHMQWQTEGSRRTAGRQRRAESERERSDPTRNFPPSLTSSLLARTRQNRAEHSARLGNGSENVQSIEERVCRSPHCHGRFDPWLWSAPSSPCTCPSQVLTEVLRPRDCSCARDVARSPSLVASKVALGAGLVCSFKLTQKRPWPRLLPSR